MTFSYDGSNFKGYQKQIKERTIQSELEKALTKINGDIEVKVCASGRTDAGVHAYNQKAHFDIDKEIEEEKLKHKLNSLLPDDIYVRGLVKVKNDFHARFDVKAKEYIYKINLGQYNPIERNYIFQFNKRLDIPEMERALKYLEGEHCFKAFTKNDRDEEKEDYVRNIIQATLVRDTKNINKITICLLGNGFLRYMVRNIVGLLIDVGTGKIKSEDVIEILASEDRTKAGICAPACGLYLNDVYY